MKKLLFALLFTIFSMVSFAQCPPKVTINCDSTFTIEIPNLNAHHYTVSISGANFVSPYSQYNVMANPNGVTVFTTPISGTPYNSQYSVSLAVWMDAFDPYQAYACPYSTVIACPTFGCKPAGLIGYTYQWNQTPYQSIVCPFVSNTNPGNGKGKKNGK